jgi:hypothetical protein
MYRFGGMTVWAPRDGRISLNLGVMPVANALASSETRNPRRQPVNRAFRNLLVYFCIHPKGFDATSIFEPSFLRGSLYCHFCAVPFL